ncbi:TORTIFOLIA1-like protein 3 [Primulina tabacum]|uniref:TORTIFOLIA1-like protein 3 n=1 Tax=Primulina tabacum TaxID=48773 RepID=UPI003F594DA5
MSDSKSKKAQLRDLKHRVLSELHKLADRDTHSSAALELESIAKTLSADALPSFVSSISATDSADKSLVRRQCLRLVSILSEHHGDSLSPYLSKLLSSIVRRLRDPDSSIRSSCVAATLSISSNLTNPPFTSITKPFIESLFVEQDLNAQNGAALCLAAVMEGSRNIDIASLRKLLPRLEKLAKCESFKAKAALLTLIGGIVGVEGVLRNCGSNAIKNLVACLMEFLSSDEWAARKAAAEALMKVTRVEKNTLSEEKTSCLKTFEAKRFDKVKSVRETMNQMIEAWKEIPDPCGAVSPQPESGSSFKEKGSTEHYPPGSKTNMSSITRAKSRSPLQYPVGRTSFSDNSPARKSSCKSTENKVVPVLFRKLDLKKLSNSNSKNTWDKVEKDLELIDEVERSASSEIKCARIDDMYDKQLCVSKSGGEVVPCGDASVLTSNETGDLFPKRRESEELSLIRKQLVQIETQQSHLLDLLQRLMGSSPNFMHSLEARIRGLELALDEFSFDLAAPTRRMTRNSAAGTMLCNLPGTEFFRSKLWRKTGCLSTTVSPTSPEGFMKSSRYQLRGGRGLIMNPLAEIPTGS